MKKTIFALSVLGSVMIFSQEKSSPQIKEKQIEGVVINKTKKAVEQKADRTIFDFSEQPHLNNGTLMEGVKKLPGLIVSDVAGMMYQGKQLDVFMDGRPLGIGGNQLTAFLEGMPANSVEKVEVITQPGAEFPATSGGAIINIITNKNAKKYLSATYTGRYAFSDYDKFRSRVNNSILLNAKNKYFGWQLNVGQNYRENYQQSEIDDITGTFSDRNQRGYFVKTALTFDVGNDRLLANYDWNYNNNDAKTTSFGFQGAEISTIPTLIDYTTNDLGKTLNTRHEASLTYQKKFEDSSKKLDFQLSFNQYLSEYNQYGSKYFQNLVQTSSFDTNSKQNTLQFKVDYSQPIKILEDGKISMGGLYENVNFDTQSHSVTNLDYQRQTTGIYTEAQTKFKKFDFIVGARAENYDIGGKVLDYDTNLLTKELTQFNKFKVFPNASIQYNFMKQIYLALNYNKKIQLPSISSLNPNNTNYQNANIGFGGNPFLQPTIYNNFEVKISAFDYAFIGYNVSFAENQSVQIADKNYFFPNQPVVNGREAYGVRNGFVNISSMKIHNFNVGMPIPFMIFNTSIKEMMKFNFNPDKINFMYVYAGYQVHELPDVKNNGFWIFNIMTQVILPKEIKLIANYSTMTKGNWYYYSMEKPWMNSIDLTASKKFMNERLTVSVFANDIFRMNRNAVTSLYNNSNIFLGNRFDGQNFGVSINYKIPTKNKLAKEDPNILNTTKKEDNGDVLQQGQ